MVKQRDPDGFVSGGSACLLATGIRTLAALGLLVAAAATLAGAPLLKPSQVFAGARIEPSIDLMATPLQRRPQFAGYVTWMTPTAIAVRGTYLYVVDAGRQQVYRYDLVRQSMSSVLTYPAAGVTGLAVAPDYSIYLPDPGARRVLHVSAGGKLLQSFSNPRELAQPVAVAFDEGTGQVWVADAVLNQIVVFNSLGLLLDAIRLNETRSIVAMARGPAGLYLVDRVGQQVVLVGRDGREYPGFGAELLREPAAIAVDQHSRVFVADNFDRSIKVFKGGELMASLGGDSAASGMSGRIGGMWIEGNTLYAADSQTGRVQSFTVEPPQQEGLK